jgi:hypothetical protein
MAAVTAHPIHIINETKKLESINDTTSEDVKVVPELGEPNDQRQHLFSFWRRRKQSLDTIATQPSVFDDPATLEVYRPPPEYENTHRFDPLARWTWREEKVRCHTSRYAEFAHALGQAVVRKVDKRVMIWAFIMFFSLDLDRFVIARLRMLL